MFKELVQSMIPWLVLFLLVLLVFVILVVRFRRWLKINWARRRHELDREEMKKRWKRIQRLGTDQNSDAQHLAIIEADKLLDFVLERMHMPGGNMARRLQFATNKFYELKRVRWAHGLRNKLVHEQNISLSRSTTRAALKEFEQALIILGAL